MRRASCREKRAAAIFALWLAMIFALAATADTRPRLDGGTVTDKRCEAPYDEMKMHIASEVAYYGKTLPHGGRWEILVCGVTDGGKTRSEWWEVDEALYERAAIGETVRRAGDEIRLVP